MFQSESDDFSMQIVRYQRLDLSPNALLWYFHTTFDMSMTYIAKSDGRLAYSGGERKLPFLRNEDDSLAFLPAYKQSVPKPVTDLFRALAAIFAPLYPKVERPDQGNEKEIEQILAAPIPPMPIERLQGLDDQDEIAEAEEIWKADVLTGRRLAEKPVKKWSEPEIDYAPVLSHDAVHRCFMNALIAHNTPLWNIYANDAAEDQLPILKRRFRAMLPNAAPVIATDSSSQIIRSGVARSGTKRSRADGDAQMAPNGKRQRTNGVVASLTSRSSPPSDEADSAVQDDARPKVKSAEELAEEPGYDTFFSNLLTEGTEEAATRRGGSSRSMVLKMGSALPSGNTSDVFS